MYKVTTLSCGMAKAVFTNWGDGTYEICCVHTCVCPDSYKSVKRRCLRTPHGATIRSQHYEIEREDGNNFYKRLLKEGWVKT